MSRASMVSWGAVGLALAGMLACGGSSDEVKVTGTDTDALATSPAGAATLSFMDLESIRPDDGNLAAPSGAPAKTGAPSKTWATAGCRSFATTSDGTTRTSTFTLAGCTAANGWTLNGTVVYTNPVGNPGSYTATFDLHSRDTTGTRTWAYTGSKNVAIAFASSTATVTVPSGTYLTVAYQDSADTSKNKTYHYAPNLTADWGTLGHFKLWGGFTFQQVGGPAVTATVLPTAPLDWTSACCYPTQGALTLSAGTASATATFGPGCGDLSFNGTSFPLSCQ